MSSTIRQAIEALKGRIADAYTAISAKGGTIPAQPTVANLPDAIASIPSGGTMPKVKIQNSPSFSTLQYEDMGEQSFEHIGSFSFDGVCSGCTYMKKFDLRGIEIQNGVSSWYNRTTFSNCINLEEVYLNNEDLAKTTPNYGTYDIMFNNCVKLRVLRVGSWCVKSLNITLAGAMTRETLVDFLNDLPNPVDNNQSIIMGSAKLNMLTADDRAIATSKGWSLS